MKNILFITIMLFLFTAAFALSRIPQASAMSKRPSDVKKAENEEFVLPEIEIISRPEANIELLSGDRKKVKSSVHVSAPEVIPAVGTDASIRKNSYRITDIQKALTKAGFDLGGIDGKMGPKTKRAIQAFQKKHNLTVDGIVGAKTWEKLKAYIN
ncbi:MAG: peptidoglycan-binding protein [Candidatus Omnitrophica bacterium]|nr:peptidoglycan-binding protein [Candidatus Omnitrophota bacterium]